MNRAKFVGALLRGSPKRRSTMLNGAYTMRSLLALGLLMTLCASTSSASGVRTHSAGHSMNYGRYYGSYGRYYGGFGPYSGRPNHRGRLARGRERGPQRPESETPRVRGPYFCALSPQQ